MTGVQTCALPICPKYITVNNTTVSVGQNLWNALRSLRLKDKARTIWVDALCINQEDISERNEQVLIMNRIYREATKVLIYLGESSEDTDAVFSVSATVRRQLSLPWATSTKLSTEKAKACMTLCYRPYWRRVWIIQEILSASKLEILCGTNSMEWCYFSEMLKEIAEDVPSSVYANKREFDNAVLSSAYLEEVRRACASSPASAIVHLYHSTGGTYSLRELLDLCSTCGSECKDVRDRIYGLLSLCRDVGDQLVPDYTKSSSQLYLDVLVTWLGHSFISTLDERPDWLRFMENLQVLLRDPLWNNHLEAFEPAHRLGRTVQLSKMQTTLRDVWIQRLSNIVCTGPIVRPSEKEFAIDYAEANWRIFENESGLKDAIRRLTSRDFHRTERINARYVLGSEDGFFYVSLSLEEQNILLRTRSTGRCCVFRTAEGSVGIASHRIQSNDLLCKVVGIDELFLVIRTTDDGRRIILVGRALVLLSGAGDAHLPRPDISAVISSRLSRSFIVQDASQV